MTPERLTISFWIFHYLGRTPGDAYHDLERCFIELKERGFNTVRLDSGAGLCHDAAGKPRGALDFHDAFPECRYLRQWPKLASGCRCDVLESMVELFTLARKYEVKVILSSWFYLHIFWFVERRIRDEFFQLPVGDRFMRFARDLALLLDELKRRGLAGQVAFAEIFNESEVLPEKWRMFEEGAEEQEIIDAMHLARRWHEEAIAFVRSRHPDILLALDTSRPSIVRPEGLPRNTELWNLHHYYAWPVYFKELETPVFARGFDFASAGVHPELGRWLRSPLTSIETIRERCGNDDEYEPGWYARVWLYHNFNDELLPELESRLAAAFRRDLPHYRRRLEEGIRRAAATRDWLLPQARLVMGEGVTYCPLPAFRWEEKCDEYWELVEYSGRLLAGYGFYGFMPRTNSGPDDPVWREFPERLRRANAAFSQT